MKSAHRKAKRWHGSELGRGKSYKEIFAKELKDTWATARSVMATKRAFETGVGLSVVDANTARQLNTDGRIAA